jgi:hypothetical protein
MRIVDDPNPPQGDAQGVLLAPDVLERNDGEALMRDFNPDDQSHDRPCDPCRAARCTRC